MITTVELVWCEHPDHGSPRGTRLTNAAAHSPSDECVWPMPSGIFGDGRVREVSIPSMTAVETLDPREAIVEHERP